MPCFTVTYRRDTIPAFRVWIAANKLENSMDTPSQGTLPTVSPREDRLDSWKEIAAYLNRDVTTVQRWEKREGMPVHRHLHDQMGSVYASRAELDAWTRSRAPVTPARANHDMPASVADIPTDLLPLKHDSDSGRLPAATSGAVAQGEPQGIRRGVIVTTGIAVVALALGSYFYFHEAPKLTDKDTIVIADFTNKTGDSVFDDTLRQGLSVQLEQSPFLSLVSDQRIQQTLRLMGQPADTRLTPEISREVCQRTGSKAVVDGSIAQIGTQYSLILRAVNCSNGESLTSAETQVSDKSRILDALGKTGSDIRNKLGESRISVQKFDTPLQQATTTSLEALRAYSLGRKSLEGGDHAAAIPLFQSAVRSDPNFAMAYANLGTAYYYIGEDNLGGASTAKAYELRDRVSEREKFYIESHYYYILTGDIEKAQQIFELWGRIYPRDASPHNWSAVVYAQLGLEEKALEQSLESHRLGVNGATYNNLVSGNTALNRLESAAAIAREARAKGFDSPNLRFSIYTIAFLQNDTAGMKEQVDWAVGKQPEEEWMLNTEASTAVYSGQLGKARELWRRARALAERRGTKETLAAYETDAAWREVHVGNLGEARKRATAAVALSTGREVACGIAPVLAMAGDAVRARSLADDLARRFTENTALRFSCLPTIQARIALSHHDPTKAIGFLQVAAPYEVGMGGLYPAYLRGEAYLAAHQGVEAAAEFQKILDHRGIVGNGLIGALTHLQIGRAYALKGDTTKAKAAYQDFLVLWKDADHDIPILIAAKAEYAKLK
jgi:eukaryotic-like serine/threonine-protein kinase